MSKIMVSLSDKTETRLRKEADDKYFGKTGALSIIVEMALKEYFDGGKR